MYKKSVLVALLLATCLQSETALAQGPLDFLRPESSNKYGLDLVAPGDVLGVVVDAEDKGVPGATVYLSPSPESRWNAKISLKTVTDDRGQFVFSDVKPRAYDLAAVKGDRASRTKYRKWQKVDHKPRLDAEPIVLTLKPARQIEVLVTTTGEDGEPQPLPRAVVKVSWHDLRQVLRTDNQGLVRFEGLLPQSHTVEACGPGLAKLSQRISSVSTVTRRVTFNLQRGAILEGRIVDEKGEPLAGVWVSARPPGDPAGFSNGVRTNKNGEYRLPNTAAGVELDIFASLDDYLPLRTKKPSLSVGETATANWTLRRRPYGGAVEGVVLDAEGAPIGGAEITNWGRSSNQKRTATTDINGRFRLDDLYSSRGGAQVIVQAPGHIGETRPVETGPRDAPKSYKFRLKPGNRLIGRVIDEQGKPVADAQVQFGQSFFGLGEEKRTDREGFFEFDTLPANASIHVTARNLSSRRHLTLALNTTEPVEIVLPPIGKILGIVVDDATGKPITDFHARGSFSPDQKPGDPSGSLNNETYEGQQFASSDGRFEFNNLTVGMPLMIVAKADGYRTASLRRVVVPRVKDAKPIEVRLKPLDENDLITVAGRVLDVRGQPTQGVQVCLLATKTDKDQHDRRTAWYAIHENRIDLGDYVLQALFTTSDAQGRFEFEGVYRDSFLEIAHWGSAAAATRRAGIEKLNDEELAKLELPAIKPATLRVSFEDNFPRFDSVQLSAAGREWWQMPNNLQANQPDTVAKSSNTSGKKLDEEWGIRQIPPGSYRLNVYKYVPMQDRPEFTTSESVAARQVTLVPGEVRSLRIAAGDRILTNQSGSIFKAVANALSSAFSAKSKKSASDKPASPAEKAPSADE